MFSGNLLTLIRQGFYHMGNTILSKKTEKTLNDQHHEQTRDNSTNFSSIIKNTHPNDFFKKIPHYSTQFKVIIWALYFLITAFFASSLDNLKIDMSLESFFADTEPTKQAYDQFRAYFGSDEVVYIIYKALDGDIFSNPSLKTLQTIQNDLINHNLKYPELNSVLNHITEVKTLLNVQYMEATADTLISRDFIGNKIPLSDSQRHIIKQQARNHPDYPLMYFSDDMQYGGIIIKTDFNAQKLIQANDNTTETHSLDEEDFEFDETLTNLDNNKLTPHTFIQTEMTEYTPFLNAIKAITHQPEHLKNLSFHPTGRPVIMSFFGNVIIDEMAIISTATIIIISIVLWILFKSFCAVVWSITIIVTSLIWTMGLISLTGVTMSAMVQIIVLLTLAVGVSDSVHILSGYLYFKNQGESHTQAILSVYRTSALACFLTSITTAIGLMALILVPIEPVQNLGIFASIGVFFTFIISVGMLPLMLNIWSPEATTKNRSPHLIQTILQKNEHFSYQYPKIILSLFIGLSIILLFGARHVYVDSNLITIIKKDEPIRQDFDLVDRVMAGIGTIEILVDSGKTDGINQPNILQAMADLQDHLESSYGKFVVDSMSLVNVTKDAYRTLNEGKPDYFIIPNNPRVLQQTLFLFNNANSNDRRQLVTDDYRYARIQLNTRNFGSKQGLKIQQNIQRDIDRIMSPLKSSYPNLNVSLTGQLPLLTLMVEYISWSQIKSFAIALGVISVLLLLVFSSVKVGLIALFPNIFPIIMIFGVMGYMKIPLDMDTLLIAPIIIGIVVDDTVHFLTHYRLAFQRTQSIQESIVTAFREAGQAITFTSLILSLGFLTFIFSAHQGLSHFGFLSAIAIMTALLTDLLLLPSLIILFKAKFT